jgi:hypothetical protein
MIGCIPKHDGFDIASGLCRMISRQPTDNGCFDQAIRHDPAFGIATLMPHAALPPQLRTDVPRGRR